MSEMRVELPCKNCGNVFSIFVREAADHKGKHHVPSLRPTSRVQLS
jgi:hypothetical protein